MVHLPMFRFGNEPNGGCGGCDSCKFNFARPARGRSLSPWSVSWTPAKEEKRQLEKRTTRKWGTGDCSRMCAYLLGSHRRM